MQSSAVSKAYLAMILTTAIWGFIGVFTRRLSEAGFGAMEVSFLRMFLSVVILVTVLYVVDRDGLRIRKNDIWVFAVFGIFKLMSDYFLFEAQIRINLSLSTVLQLTAPYWVLLFSVILFGEKVTRRKVFSILIAFVGCVLSTGLLENGISYNAAGICFGILAGLSFAAYTIGNKVVLDRGYRPDTALIYILLFATVFCIPFVQPADIIGKIDSVRVVSDILVMGIVITLIPYYLQTYSTKYLSAVTVSLIALLEVFMATVVGYVFYDETLSLPNIMGLILIPLSIVIMNVNIRQILMEHNARER